VVAINPAGKTATPLALVACGRTFLEGRDGVTKRVTGEILVVDDDPDARDSLAELLELEGYAVRTAGTGREALDSCTTDGAPDLILLDLEMPVMDGWQFSREARRSRQLAKVPMVVTSAVAESAPPEATAVFSKPLDATLLLSNVRDLIKAAA
jgi:CheY-like chemotaxis protein